MEKEKNDACPTEAEPNHWRQLDVFNPIDFKTIVHIIGVGATGSWIAYILAKMGVRTLTIWDHDFVEGHNCPNQVYGKQEIGMSKVEAMKMIIKRDCGIDVICKPEKVDGSQPLEGIVYVCTDDMTSRKVIWDKALKLNLNVGLVVETRLAAEMCLLYTVRPTSFQDIKSYEETLYDDSEAEESVCTYKAIGTMVAMLAGAASHKVVKYAKKIPMRPMLKFEEPKDIPHESAGMICINPIVATSHAW